MSFTYCQFASVNKDMTKHPHYNNYVKCLKWQFITNNICLNRKRKAIVVRVKVHTSEKTQQLHVFDFCYKSYS